MVATPPPDPTWTGFGAEGVLTQYAAFMRHHMIEQSETGPTKLRRDLQDYEYEVEYYLRNLKEYRGKHAQAQEYLKTLKLKLKSSDTNNLQQQGEALRMLPFVLGTRLEATGDLAVLIRATAEWGGRQYDIGDFDVSLSAFTFSTGQPIHYIRRPIDPRSNRPVSFRTFPGFYAQDTAVAARTTVGVNPQDYDTPVEYLRQVYSKLTLSVPHYNREYFPLAETVPDPPWSMFLPADMTAAALLKHAESRQAPLRTQITDQEETVKQYAQTVETYVGQVRTYKQRVRDTKRELNEAMRIAKEAVGEIDQDKLVEELKYIITLPGVMGIKFDANGVPVVHIRTMIVHAGRKYYMGDFEVTLHEPRPDFAGVLAIRQTKSADEREHGREHKHLYFHRDFSYDWFCFGSRREDLRELFRLGDMGALLHLMINTMNAVNDYQEGYISEYYPEIPLDYVYRNTISDTADFIVDGELNVAAIRGGGRRGRKRPRRRPAHLRNERNTLGAQALIAAGIVR